MVPPSHPAAEALSVAICIATFGRPQGLAALLESLDDLARPESVEITVIVVDNDPAGSGRGVVHDHAPRRLPLQYAVEPRPGIPFARNHAVSKAQGADYVAFLDDDEQADPGWLEALLEAAARTRADIVVGPVVPRFAHPAPAWLRRADVFAPLRYRDEEEVGFAYTGNVLVAGRLFADDPHPFDERFAATGGSDTHFFMRAHLGGARIVWAANAVVYETIPAARARPSWLIRRDYRRGNTLSLCLLDLEDSKRRRARRALHGVARVLLGASHAATFPLRGRRALLAGARQAALGLGMITGLFGYAYQEYRRTDPPPADPEPGQEFVQQAERLHGR
jgi:succinoglycan biosynthesis protein ExoM